MRRSAIGAVPPAAGGNRFMVDLAQADPPTASGGVGRCCLVRQRQLDGTRLFSALGGGG